jgi:hypothetical protein
MQIRLIDVSIAYYVDSSLRTASEGEVVSDLPDADAQRLIDTGKAERIDTLPPDAPTPKRKRGV